jgi:hypothetical protein
MTLTTSAAYTAIQNAAIRFGLASQAFSPNTLAFLHQRRTPVLKTCEALDLHTQALCEAIVDDVIRTPFEDCLRELNDVDTNALFRMRRDTSLTYLRALVRAPLSPVQFETQSLLCGCQLQLMLHSQLLEKKLKV